MDYSYTQSGPNHNQYHQQYQPQPEAAAAASAAPYDPSTIQPYDHSYQPYYSSYDPHQHYQYYNPTSQDYANSYNANPQFHPEPTSIHPPGVPIPAPPPQTTDSETAHLPKAYYAPGVVENQPPPQPQQQQQINSGSGADGSNPAPVSEPTQIPGNADVALQPPIGQTPFRGGGRRGNRPFRGGGRGHLGYHGPTPDGSAPPFRGRGRGQSGGRHFQLYGAASSNPNSASVPAEGVAASMQPPSALVPGQAPLPVPTQVSSASFWRPPRMAWCELCRVDCNTPEILEQHKNGKRHKKNLQVHGELQLQKLNKVRTEQQNAQMPNTELKPEVGHPEKVEGFEEKQPSSQEKLTSEVVTDDNRNDTDKKDTVGNSEASAEPEIKSGDHFAARGRGLKRRGRGGRGGKYMRTNEGSRRPVEPPRPKQVIPFICELCNVKCESQVVFDSHLSGKKHLATLKRFEGHRALYGEQGLQALYPSNLTAASTSVAPHVQQGVIDPQVFLNQIQQGVSDPQVLLAQLLMSYVLSQTQAQGTAPPSGPTSGVAPAPGTSFGIQSQLHSQIQGILAKYQDVSQNAVMVDTKSQLQSVNVNSKAPAAGNTDTNTENGTSEIEPKEANVTINDTVVIPAENAGPSEQVSEKASDKECEELESKKECEKASDKVVFASAPVQPEPENQMQELESKKEEPTE